MIKRFFRNVLRFLGNRLLFHVVNLLCKTVKIKQNIPRPTRDLFKSGNKFVVAFWHGTMLIPWFLFRDSGMSAIISQSKDGELLARVLEKWKYKVERGSSSSGGKEVLETLIENASGDYSVAITPDGPRGPVHEMKPGAAIAAKKAGVPLILLGSAYEKYYQFKSWDKFRMPKFFTKAYVVASEPIFIPKELSYDETSVKIKECETELNVLQKKAEVFN